MIAIALVGLNVAAVLYRPPLDASGPQVARRWLKEGGLYLIKGDGDFDNLSQNHDLVFTWCREAGLAKPGPESPPVRISEAILLRGMGIKVATIMVGDDGSVLGYGGRAGEMTSKPVVLRPPSRSRLEMWWPLVASIAITAVVAVVLWRRARRGRPAAEPPMARGSTTGMSAAPLREWTIIGAALAALNVAGAIEVRGAHFRERASRVRLVERSSEWFPSQWDDRWGIGFPMGQLDTGKSLARLVRLPMRTSPVAIWAPVIASVSITLLTLVVLTGPRRRPGVIDSAHPAERRTPTRLLRRATTAAALIGLNGAAAVHGPFPEPGYEEPCPKLFDDPAAIPDIQGDRLIRNRDGRLMKRPADGGAERPVTAADYPPPLHEYDARTRVNDTIVYNSDGSVVDYAGNPGWLERLISRPRVIKPPTRSLLEVWWPVIGGVSISLVAIGILWRQGRSRYLEPQPVHAPGLDSAEPSL